MQPAHRPDHVLARTQVEVICIAEDDLGPRALHLTGVKTAYGAVGSHRHEGRGLDGAVGQHETAGARVAVGGFWRELEHAMKLHLGREP